ncbi:MAG: hypothetical protein E6Q27_00910 [Aeromicrobium sp.]|nr:MAG: hypothetical protein E6Q27_00910 [Aeromicrobium sp.]
MLHRPSVPSTCIQSHDDLHQMWHAIRDPWVKSDSRLRFVLMDARGKPWPFPIEIDVSPATDRDRLALVLDIMADMMADLAPGGSLAVQIVSTAGVGGGDFSTQWAEVISSELAKRNLDRWPMYATDGTQLIDVRSLVAARG